MSNKLKSVLNKIRLFFQGLSGKFNEEYDDDQGYDPKELEELNKMSAKVTELEQTHGVQTMTVDKDKDDEETDRLGNKKPKSLKREGATSKTERKEQPVRDDGRDL